jgi:hypothetical protein
MLAPQKEAVKRLADFCVQRTQVAAGTTTSKFSQGVGRTGVGTIPRTLVGLVENPQAVQTEADLLEENPE